MAAVHPCAEQPCLHRVLAECSHDQVVRVAGLYGLLTATGKILPPEPVDLWRREIRELRNATALWDALAGADVPLQEEAASRLLWAVQSGELARYRNEYVDLAAQVIAALGRWHVDAARPYLERLLRNPPVSFSPVARAHLRRAVLQLVASRQ